MLALSPAASKGTPTASEALRHATADIHERLHAAPAFDALVRQCLDRDGYRLLLARIRRFHGLTLHSRLRALRLLDLSDAGVHRRLELLDDDLRYLGRSSDVFAPTWTPPGDDAGAVGCLYVVEGSMLGGKVLHRQLHYLFGDADEGRRFFRGGADDGAGWRRFREALGRYGAAAGRLPAMVGGATATFELFETCLGEETRGDRPNPVTMCQVKELSS